MARPWPQTPPAVPPPLPDPGVDPPRSVEPVQIGMNGVTRQSFADDAAGMFLIANNGFRERIERMIEAVSGRLIRTRRGYEEPGPPDLCPAGHPLRGPHRVLVGTQQCSTCAESGHGAHRSFTCRVCNRTAYDPEPRAECSFVAFDGRAVPGGHP